MKILESEPRPDPPTPIAIAMRAWEHMQSRLVPALGKDGFCILFARSLHLTRRDFPWLGSVPQSTGRQVEDLQASLEAETTSKALEGNAALLATFTGLLHALIGEALASRLLKPAEPGSAAGP